MASIKTLSRFNFNTLTDLCTALDSLRDDLYDMRVRTDVVLANCDTLALVEMTLTDGSKVYNISLT